MERNMEVTLPVSKRRVDLVCLPYKDCQEMLKAERDFMLKPEGAEKTQAIFEGLDKRRERLMALYPDIDFEDMPSRDILLLLDATYRYSMAEPVAAVKNLFAGGDGAATANGPTTAPTVTQ